MATYKIILTILFVFAGSAKLFSAKAIQEQFEEFGLPKYVMFGVGCLEVLGAVGLHVKNVAFYAAFGLLLLLIGALVNHLKVKHPFSKIAPSLLLFMALGIYLYLSLK